MVICSRISCQIEIIKKREKTRKGEKSNGRIKESKKCEEEKTISEAELGLLHLGCRSSPRCASEYATTKSVKG